MITLDQLRAISLSFPETTEDPHFEKTSFRFKKKIIATYDQQNNRACLKLSAEDQDVFSLIEGNFIYPVPNKWGKQGWTLVNLDLVSQELMEELLQAAYAEVTNKRTK